MNAYLNPRLQPPPNIKNDGPLPTNFWQSAGGAYTYTPEANQTVASQIGQLTAPGANNAYINNAVQNAQAAMQARGIGNSSYAGGNASRAAIEAALPIAQQDADMFAKSALQNSNMLNQTGMNNANNATSRANSTAAAAASRYGSDRSYAASIYGQNAETERQQEQNQFDSTFKPYMLDLQNQYGAQDWARNTYSNILTGAYATMFSDPSYFNNPEAAMGFINGFGNFASNQVNQYLYGDTGSP